MGVYLTANVFTQIEQATKELRQQGVDGPLTLSAPHFFIHYWLIPRLGNLKACSGRHQADNAYPSQTIKIAKQKGLS